MTGSSVTFETKSLPFAFFVMMPSSLVLIAIDDEALLAGDGEEGQHVAARERRDESFLGIDRVLPRQRQRHDRGR